MKAVDSGESDGSGRDGISLTLRPLIPFRLSADAEALA